MSKVVLAGYYGFGNAGDELILSSVHGAIGRECPGAEVCVLSNDPDATRIEHGLESVNRWSFSAVLKALSGCDAMVFGGGGLLQDATGSVGLWYYLSILWAAFLFKKKTLVWAVGVGPLRRTFNRFAVAKTLSRCNAVTVRDNASKSALESMGLRGDIRLASDPVLLFDVSEFHAHRKHGRRLVSVIVRSLPDARMKRMESALAEAVKGAIEDLDAEVQVLCLHADQDMGLVERMVSACSSDRVKSAKWSTLRDLAGLLADSDLVVTLRLHGAVLATLLDIPFVAVAVDPKISQFVEELDPALLKNVVAMNDCDGPALRDAVRSVWDRRMLVKGLLNGAVQRLRRRLSSTDPGRILRDLLVVSEQSESMPLEAEPGGETVSQANARSRRAGSMLDRLKIFFLSRWILFGSFILITFLLTVLDTLKRDGAAVFQAQKSALVLEVFAGPGRKQESYDLLLEKLRALDGVKEVSAVSPDEALNSLSNSGLNVDMQWLAQKNEELKNKGGLLPWSYSLYLSRWDDVFLKDLVARVEALEVGYPKDRIVAQTHYDAERWSLIFALYNYVRWVEKVLWTSALIIGTFLVTFMLKAVELSQRKKFPWRGTGWAFLLGAASGLTCHTLYLAILSVSFFPESFHWSAHFGKFLPQQIGLCTFFVFLSYGSRAFKREGGKSRQQEP